MDSSLIIGNAAGIVKTIEDVSKYARVSASSSITVGSITVEERPGNPEPRTFEKAGAYFNALGLPNKGIAYYTTALPEMRRIADAHEMSLRVSIAGSSPEEYVTLALLAGRHASAVEVNLGCPNVWEGTEQKRIAAFCPDMVSDILGKVSGALHAHHLVPAIAVKLSPYSDPWLIPQIARAVSQYKNVTAIVTTNTFPNALPLTQKGARAISGNGFAGMSGRAMKEVALGQIAQFRAVLPERISITGVGGIFSGADARDHLYAGAREVQVGTACWLYGPRAMQDIAVEYAVIES